jgi:Cdc6-like AAA superfamily ATPase
MQNIDYDNILDRKIYKEQIIDFLEKFEKNKNQLNEKRGIYLSGDPGIGKTKFVCNLLKKSGYDVIYYDSSDMRNKNIMELITNHNMSNINVYTMFTRERKKIVIVMDDIDGMNNGDKGGINSLIKIIRPKKTKKQKQEELSMNPIICIGNNQIDKKIRELVSQCKSINLNTPTPNQISGILKNILDSKIYNIDKLLDFIGNDLRKVSLINNATKDQDISFETLNSLFSKNFLIDDIKLNVKEMLNTKQNFETHNSINETDITIFGLLWHENVIEVFNNSDYATMK